MIQVSVSKYRHVLNEQGWRIGKEERGLGIGMRERIGLEDGKGKERKGEQKIDQKREEYSIIYNIIIVIYT